MNEKIQEVVKKILSGDIDAFEKIVLENETGIRAYLAVRIRDYHEAENLAQEVFITAFKKLKEFDTSRSMMAWLRGIAKRLFLNHVKRRKERVGFYEGELEMLVERNISVMREEKESEEMILALRKCLERLDENSLTMIQHRYSRELSIAAISNVMKQHHSTITMRLHRIRQGLHHCIERHLLRVEGGL